MEITKLKLISYIFFIGITIFSIGIIIGFSSGKRVTRSNAEDNLSLPPKDFTVCPDTTTYPADSCSYYGGDGIQQAINDAPSDPKTETVIKIRKGTYTRTTPEIYGESKQKSFLFIQNKNIFLLGIDRPIIDGSIGPAMNGIVVLHGKLTLKNVNISKFKESSKYNEGNGVVLMSQNFSIKILDTDITYNDGKGIFGYPDSLEISNSIIENNKAGGLDTGSSNTVSIYKTRIRKNGSEIYSSSVGIDLHGSNTEISNSEISENYGDGIGIGRADTFGNATIKNSVIRDNKGFGIQTNATEEIIIKNNLFLRNNKGAVSISGSGGYIEFPERWIPMKVNIINNTFYNNSVTDMYFTGEYSSSQSCYMETQIVNNIFSNTLGSAFKVDDPECLPVTNMTTSNNLFYNIRDGWSLRSWYLTPGSINNIDPKFRDAEKGDFHLLPDSPAVDGGNPDICDPWPGGACKWGPCFCGNDKKSPSDLGAYGGEGAEVK